MHWLLLHSLFALMRVGLRHRLRQFHLKLVAAQRHLLVVVDEGEEGVEHQIVRQVELGAARLLTGVDPTVLHPAGAPGWWRGEKRRSRRRRRRSISSITSKTRS